jgi:hypothetical protein
VEVLDKTVLSEMTRERGLTKARATKPQLINMLFEHESGVQVRRAKPVRGAEPAQLRATTQENVAENVAEEELRSIIKECRSSKEKLEVIL